MASDLNVSLIIRAIDRATAPIRRVTKNFDAMRRASVRASKSFKFAADVRQAAEGVRRFAQIARSVVAAPIKEFETFQATMSGVKAVSRGITENEFAALTEKARELGATTRYTATQAAEGMKFLGMAGFDAAEQMEAIPAALDLATAATTDLGRTTDILSDIMGAFNKEASETTAVSDALAVTITGSNTTLETLFETMKLVGPIATDLKIPLHDVAAMAGLMGSAGIKGSLAGTALRATMQKLVAPTKRGAEALEYLKVATEDANRNLRPLPDILADVQEATQDMGTAQRAAILKDIFGVRAISGVSKLLGKIKGGEMRKFAAEIRDSTGAAKEMALIMDDNAAGATIKLQSALSGLLITIGKELEPALTSIKETLTKIIQGITGWAKEHPNLTKALAMTAGAVAVLATAMTGAMFILATLASAAGLASLAAGLGGTTAAILGMAGPIGWVILAIGALAVAGFALWRNWDAIVSWFLGAWGRFKNASLGLKIAVIALLAPFIAVLSPIIALGFMANWVIDNWEPVKGFFADLWAGIIEGAKKTWRVVQWALDPLGSAGKAVGVLDRTFIEMAADAAGGAAREAAWAVGGGEYGAADYKTEAFMQRTAGESALAGEAKVVIEFINGVPTVRDSAASGGVDVETAYTGSLEEVWES